MKTPKQSERDAVVVKQFELTGKRQRIHWWPKLHERTSDGAYYVASHPGHPYFWGWYFRRVTRVAGQLYRETGDVWCVLDETVRPAKRTDTIVAIMSLWRFSKRRGLRVPFIQSVREYFDLVINLIFRINTVRR